MPFHHATMHGTISAPCPQNWLDVFLPQHKEHTINSEKGRSPSDFICMNTAANAHGQHVITVTFEVSVNRSLSK